MIMAVFLFPAGIFAGGIPDDLRIGTHEKIISPAFQLFSAGCIQHFIIFPLICDPHIFIPHFVSNIVTGIICKVSGQNCICACMHRIIIRDNHTGSGSKKQSFYCWSVAMEKSEGRRTAKVRKVVLWRWMLQGLCNTIRYALKISTSGINSEIPLRRTKGICCGAGSGIGCGSGCRAEAEGRQDPRISAHPGREAPVKLRCRDRFGRRG